MHRLMPVPAGRAAGPIAALPQAANPLRADAGRRGLTRAV